MDFGLQRGTGTNLLGSSSLAAGVSSLPWNPVVDSSNADFVLGNGSTTGLYSLVGQLCLAQFFVQAGSTTNPGT